MILTPQELRNYSPTLSRLTDTELEGLVLRSQGLCESHLGANRELEIKEYWETKTLNNTSQIGFIYAPLAEVISVEIRYNNSLISFGDISVNQDWEMLSDDEYSVTEDLNLPYLKINKSFNNFNFIDTRRIRRGLHNNRIIPEVRIRYEAGLNFSLNTTAILKLKSAIAVVAENMHREQGFVKEETSQGAKLIYQDFNSLNPYANYLALFYRYRPRT